MTERPIIFTGESVRAILDGRKTQTRRVVRDDPNAARIWWTEVHEMVPGGGFYVGWVRDSGAPLLLPVCCPYGVPGDRLWVREAWALPPRYDPIRHGDLKSPPSIGPVCFAADYSGRSAWEDQRGWRSPMFMPRWASRLTLEVTEVRVQRLQDITEEDARAEGVVEQASAACVQWSLDSLHWHGSPRLAFWKGWDSINGKRAPWASNPWVWAISFKRAERPA
jgi:hypothetical protein